MGREQSTDDSFYSIGDISEKTGIKPYILRYWEREFPFLQPIKNKAGHRLYTQRDIYLINNIKELLYNKGYSIAGAKKVLWKILLGKKDSPVNKFIEDIKSDLYEALDEINKTLL